MQRASSFSYLCRCCGRCCHNQVITLSPYDVIRMARAAHISTGEAVTRYTLRRGSLLRFEDSGRCIALDGAMCSIHVGRPLACRLYPIGMQRLGNGVEKYVRLQPASGSRGVYGDDGTVLEFLAEQRTEDYFQAVGHYARLIPVFRQRIAELVDFDLVEPREFWRVAIREALAEKNFDPNALVEALFDPDGLGCGRGSVAETVTRHVREIAYRIRLETRGNLAATAAILLAISLGYSPSEVIPPPHHPTTG